MSRPGTDLARPWTVIALSAWSVLSLLWGLFFIDGWQIGDLLSIGLSIAFVRGYWMGQRWAFHLTFASAILCGIFLIGHVIFASEASSALAKVFSVLIIVGMIYLVLHPATKRFVRQTKNSRVQDRPGRRTVGAGSLKPSPYQSSESSRSRCRCCGRSETSTVGCYSSGWPHASRRE